MFQDPPSLVPLIRHIWPLMMGTYRPEERGQADVGKDKLRRPPVSLFTGLLLRSLNHVIIIWVDSTDIWLTR